MKKVQGRKKKLKQRRGKTEQKKNEKNKKNKKIMHLEQFAEKGFIEI